MNNQENKNGNKTLLLYLAQNGSAEANNHPLQSINKIIKREKPNIYEAIKPDPVILEQSRWCPKHVLKLVELEDVITQQKYPSSSVFVSN